MLPPCHQPGDRPNACAAERYHWLTNGTGDLWGAWSGWRIAGRELVSPDGYRVSARELAGMLFIERNRRRATKCCNTTETATQQRDTSR